METENHSKINRSLKMCLVSLLVIFGSIIVAHNLPLITNNGIFLFNLSLLGTVIIVFSSITFLTSLFSLIFFYFSANGLSRVFSIILSILLTTISLYLLYQAILFSITPKQKVIPQTNTLLLN